MRKKDGNKFLKKTLPALSILGICFIAGIMYTMSLQDVIENPLDVRSWKPGLVKADGDPGGDNSGFMYFMSYPHQAAPAVAYASNLSNATAYEFLDSLNGEMTGETPYNTAFDFVMKFRANDTVAYNTTTSTWEDTWVRANITCDFDFAVDIGPDAAMTIVQIGNNTDFAWYHAYINNGAAGYQITHNEKFNVTSLTADGYY